ncbi:hypothetical protein [Streptomyces sp. NBC_00005]|uniref:hypothetical protein n=1 Tax=Streptomyces sp. NBC_00005 TaxID=2903609 RepID=UPI00324816DB
MVDETSRNAIDDPDALRAWQVARRRSTTAFTFWGISLPGFPVLAMVLWEPLVGGSLPGYAIAPLVIVSAVGLVLSERRWSQVKQMRGILAVYPFKDHPPLKSVSAGDIAHFQLPDPDAPNKKVSVVALRYGLGKQWRNTMAEVRDQGFVLAGDPRFGMVITPRERHELIAVRPKHPQLTGGRPNGVDESSWHQARAAGIAH